MPMRGEIVMSGENKSDLAFKMMDYICFGGRNFHILKKKKKKSQQAIDLSRSCRTATDTVTRAGLWCQTRTNTECSVGIRPLLMRP